MTNQPATTSIARKARKALSAALYNAARIAAADIAKLDATYGEFAQRKVDAVNADSPVEMLIKVAVDLVLIADRMDREIEAPETQQPNDIIVGDIIEYDRNDGRGFRIVKVTRLSTKDGQPIFDGELLYTTIRGDDVDGWSVWGWCELAEVVHASPVITIVTHTL